MMLDLFDQVKVEHFQNPAAASPETGYPDRLQGIFDIQASQRAVKEISHWQDYRPTQLISLGGLAAELGLARIYYKDESTRFGLGSFKSLGGAYEVLCLLQEQLTQRLGRPVSFSQIRNGDYTEQIKGITVITATDGNHGRSVAWGAQLFGCSCVIYIHAEVSAGRKTAMEEFGARVVRIDGNYDDSVDAAAVVAAQKGWFIVSDTSYEGYTELPRHVMAGYTVMSDEIIAQLPADTQLSHTFVQGGVGGLGGAMCGYLWQRLGVRRPRFIIVEPDRADCLYQSARNGRPTLVNVTEESLMAGMSCGKVSDLAWQILSQGCDDFMTIPDQLVAPSMRFLAYGHYGDRPIVAGESATAGLAALISVCLNPNLKQTLGLNEKSQILLFGTEGATDPQIYEQLVNRTAEEIAESAVGGETT